MSEVFGAFDGSQDLKGARTPRVFLKLTNSVGTLLASRLLKAAHLLQVGRPLQAGHFERPAHSRLYILGCHLGRLPARRARFSTDGKGCRSEVNDMITVTNSVYLSSIMYGNYNNYHGANTTHVKPTLDQQRQKRDEEALGGKIKISKFEDYLKRG